MDFYMMILIHNGIVNSLLKQLQISPEKKNTVSPITGHLFQYSHFNENGNQIICGLVSGL
jgi:hypothetical protein